MTIPHLLLPKRYEKLQYAAVEKKADLTQIVRKVPEATARIEQLLRQVKSGGLGRFELLLGPSGSGKTTFLSTLPRFYSGAHITPLSDKMSLLEAAEEIKNGSASPIDGQIFVLLERDNPELDSVELKKFFEQLRRIFRTDGGQVLVIWPITDADAAKTIAEAAWSIGSDSIVDDSSKGLYNFKGLPKAVYFEVADITARSLNGGLGLESFGLGEVVAKPMVQASETISQFFGRLETKSQELNNAFGDTLKERRIPSVWILVGGDDTRELNLTVANLTQGTEKRIDIDRMINVLDASDSTTGYLGDWRKRRNEVAFLLRHLDVRLFELTPNVAVSAIRAFGDTAITEKLNKKKESAANASSAMQVARFFQLISGVTSSNAATIRPATDATSDEYKRIQQLASKSDKLLNKALASCLERALQDTGVAGSVTAEQRKLDPKSNLQPDLMVDLADGRLICIEPTWRTTGVGIDGEIKEQQSSMTVGHIQQYLLAKVLEYVNDLGA